MSLLYINAAFRENSRTACLAERYLSGRADVHEVKLADGAPLPLDGVRLAEYNAAVSAKSFSSPMFDAAKQFAAADEVVIAAPFWNYTLPAVLHCYLELVCTQGVTFDMSPDGEYYTLCRAKRLTFITTSGGYIPENNHAFDYIADLCRVFWGIEDITYIKAEGLDIYGADVESLLDEALKD